MRTIQKLLAIGSLAAFVTGSILNAQPAQPEGYVDDDGNLVIGDDTIAPPEGTVDGDGNLVIGDDTITRPDAQVNEDGSLTVGDDTYSVPRLPVGLFFSNTFSYGAEAPGWQYNPVFNHYWNDPDSSAGERWFFWEEWKGANTPWFYLNTELGNESEMWLYSQHFSDWIYIKVDPDVDAWFNHLSDASDFQNGLFYNYAAAGWYYFMQDEDNGQRRSAYVPVTFDGDGNIDYNEGDWVDVYP